jgi:hypothetical protein
MNVSKAQFGNTSWNPFSAASRGIEKLGAAATTAVTNSALGQQIQASHAAEQAASAAHLEHQGKLHADELEHDKWRTLAAHVLGQEAATSEHGRRLEFFNQTRKHAEGGTGVDVTVGDYKASFTKKNRKPTTAPSVSEPAQTKGPTFVGMPSTRISAPSTSAAPVQEGPKPTVKRGPGGRMVSLKSGAAPAAPARKKKASQAPAAPLIGRDPKTGKAISLKKK